MDLGKLPRAAYISTKMHLNRTQGRTDVTQLRRPQERLDDAVHSKRQSSTSGHLDGGGGREGLGLKTASCNGHCRTGVITGIQAAKHSLVCCWYVLEA